VITVGTLVVILTAGLPLEHQFFRCATTGRAVDVETYQTDGTLRGYQVEFKCAKGQLRRYSVNKVYVLNAEALK
jgi:hypothetical protein